MVCLSVSSRIALSNENIHNSPTDNFITKTSASIETVATVTSLAKILGEDWTIVTIGDETWSNIAVGSEIWTNQTTQNKVWLEK